MKSSPTLLTERPDLMDSALLKDEVDAAIRSIRLAQAQIANIKKKHFANDSAKSDEMDSVEVILGIILKKLESLKST